MESGSYDDEVGGSGGPSKLLAVLVIGNLLLTLGVGGVVGYMFVTQSKAEPIAAGATGGADDVSLPPEPVGTYAFEPFIVNLMDAANIRYVKVTMEVELDSQGVEAELEERMPAIRDMANSVLSNRTYGELLGVRGKTQLREELLRRINQTLTTGSITRIYFTEFVVQ